MRRLARGVSEHFVLTQRASMSLAMVADPVTRRGEEPFIVGVVHNGQAGLQHCPDVPKDAEFCLVLDREAVTSPWLASAQEAIENESFIEG